MPPPLQDLDVGLNLNYDSFEKGNKKILIESIEEMPGLNFCNLKEN